MTGSSQQPLPRFTLKHTGALLGGEWVLVSQQGTILARWPTKEAATARMRNSSASMTISASRSRWKSSSMK